MKYRVVVGYYPSYNSALKVSEKVNRILSGAKLKVKECRIIEERDCFMVVLYETVNYDNADNVFSECMKHNIYCGIDVTKCTTD